MDSTNDIRATIEPPAEILCPNVREQDLILHMDVNYGLKVTKIEKLNGYDDSNFHISVLREHSNPNIKEIAANGYFIKVSNMIDSENPGTLYAQQAAMRHLRSKGIQCQSAVRSIHNEELTDIQVLSKTGEDRTHKVSVRSFLPGEIVAKSTLTPDLLFDLGTFVAKVSQALEDFSHPFYNDWDVLWSMDNFPKVAEVMHAVKDEKRREICEDVLKAFDAEVVSQKKHFRKGQVHGDLNEQNILAQEEGGRVTVCGLLDFQDMVRSHPVYDLTICAAYMMMSPHSQVPRPMMPGYILAGYLSVLKLNEEEEKAFYTLVVSRMVMSLVYGEYSYSLDPTNEYLLQTAKCGWEALISYTSIPKEELKSEWNKIIVSYKDNGKQSVLVS